MFFRPFSVGLSLAAALGFAVAAPAAYKLLPLGDSITAGSDFSQGAGFSNGGYRAPLYSQLNAANPGYWEFVGGFTGQRRDVTTGNLLNEVGPFPAGYTSNGNNRHQGVPGATIYDFIKPSANPVTVDGQPYQALFDAAATVTQYNPDAVLLSLGTNDLNGFNLNFFEGASANDPATAANRMRVLLNQIYGAKSTVKIYLGGLVGLPTDAEGDYSNADATAYNALLVGLAAEFTALGRNIQYVDLFSSINDRSNTSPFFADANLHPNSAGYNAIAGAWYAAVVPEPASLGLVAVAGLMLVRRRARA